MVSVEIPAGGAVGAILRCLKIEAVTAPVVPFAPRSSGLQAWGF